MGAACRGLVLGICTAVVLMAIAVTNAEAASVVIGLAKCGDCTRKNMKAEQAFKGLHVAIKCKNGNGEYESKAVGEVDGTGAFSVPLAADLHGADCHVQLHSASTNAVCPGQEPSKIVPLSEEEGTYGVVAGKTHYVSSSECASATMCGHVKKIFDHFHKKPVPPKPEPKPEPHPEYHPIPPSTPTYGGQPSPKPEHKPQPHPDYHPIPPTPTTPTYGGQPSSSATVCGHIKKIFDHFHKKPVPPKPESKPQPHPDYHPVPPSTPTYGGQPSSSTPIYHPPAQH